MFVDQPTAQARYDICKPCEFFKKELTQCAKCGCIMKVKVKFEKSKCPEGKWE